jgi:Spy/CpxP family protein refolding chaperone
MTAPFSAVAEGKKPPISDDQLENMQKRLELTDEQVAEMRKIRGEGGSKKDMRAVLTEQQQAKASITDEKLSKMQEKLQLSDEQVTQMRQIRDDGGSRKDVQAVLTKEQKALAKELSVKHKKGAGKKAKKGGVEA